MSYMKKNIFYFTPYYLPDNNAAAVRNFWFVKTLREDGHEVKLVTGKDLAFKLPRNTDSAIKRLLMEQIAGIALALKIIFSKNDLYFLSSPPFFTVLVASLACRLLGKKYILDIRDLYPEVFVNLGLLPKESAAYRYILKFTRIMYNGAQSIITVTEGLENKIRAHSPRADIHRIYNGYDTELFMPGHEKFDKYTVVFHGNLGKFQRIDLLVDVAREMEKTNPEIQFKVIGYGPGAEFLKNPPSNLEYLGPMKYEEIAKYIAKCHMGISLRTDDEISKDAVPVKVFEYMGVEIPVLVTPKGEASRLIEKEKLGYGLDNDLSEIVPVISKMMKLDPTSSNPKVYNRKNQVKAILAIINNGKSD